MPEFHINNRRRLIQKLHGSVFASTAHTVIQKTKDTNYPFRQDSNFWYLTGINEPNCILVIDSGGQEHLFIPQVTKAHTTWLDGGLSITEAQQKSGIQHVHYLTQKAAIIKNILGNTTEVLMPQNRKDSFFTHALNPAHSKFKRALKRYGVKKINDATPILDELRVIKTEPEIKQLATVTAFTEATLESSMEHIANFKSEQDVEAYITAEFIRHQFTHGYDPIVAGGNNAFMLHYTANNQTIAKNTAVLVDVGAEQDYYSADVTRMLEFGTMSEEYQHVKQLVAELQKFIISYLKPGTTPMEIAKAFRQELLKALKILKLLDDSAELKDTYEYCPHGFGHFLGLDVHDAGDYSQPLKENMVFMAEPGLYVAEWGVAVRLEDAYLITKQGCIKLTEVLE